MASLVSCLLRNCFDVGIENGNHNPGEGSSSDDEDNGHIVPPVPGLYTISRGDSIIEREVVNRQASSGAHSNATDSEDGRMEDIVFTDDDDEADVDPSCCDENGNPSSSSTNSPSVATAENNEGESNRQRRRHGHHNNPFFSVLHHLGIHRDGAYDSVSSATIPPSSASSPSTTQRNLPHVSIFGAPSSSSTTAPASEAVAALGHAASSRFDNIRRSFSNPSSKSIVPTANQPKSSNTPHLRIASSFDFDTDKSSKKSSKDLIPGISNDEIVLPGSDIQKQMAKVMKESGDLGDPGDECVICMDGFDPTNPRMPTLCGCGENKTYFHLPCLYQWIEQNRNCPSCRKRLRWEEF